MTMKSLLGCAAIAALLLPATQANAARDYVWAAGSSTVFPFATRVAEQFARKSGGKAPKIESLGTGGGIKLFCGGATDAFPDIANASRPMKKSEFDQCAAKGVKDIVQIKIGFDGIVIATDKDGPDYAFKTENLYLGLSANVLRTGKFVKNPYTTWDEIGAGLPGNKHPGLRPGRPAQAPATPSSNWPSRPGRASSRPPTPCARTTKPSSRICRPAAQGRLGGRRRKRQRRCRHPDQDPRFAGRLRLVLPRREHGQDEGLVDQRREAVAWRHLRWLLPAVALALHLREEVADRCHPEPAGLSSTSSSRTRPLASGGYLQSAA
jgi:hypothetical protein